LATWHSFLFLNKVQVKISIITGARHDLHHVTVMRQSEPMPVRVKISTSIITCPLRDLHVTWRSSGKSKPLPHHSLRP